MAQKSHTEQDRPRDPLVACRVARCWQWRLLRRFTSAKGRVWVKGITVLTCFELSRSGVESPWDGSGFWGRCAFVCVGCCRIAESGRSRRHESRLRIRVARVAVSRPLGARGSGRGTGHGGSASARAKVAHLSRESGSGLPLRLASGRQSTTGRGVVRGAWPRGRGPGREKTGPGAGGGRGSTGDGRGQTK